MVQVHGLVTQLEVTIIIIILTSYKMSSNYGYQHFQ